MFDRSLDNTYRNSYYPATSLASDSLNRRDNTYFKQNYRSSNNTSKNVTLEINNKVNSLWLRNFYQKRKILLFWAIFHMVDVFNDYYQLIQYYQNGYWSLFAVSFTIFLITRVSTTTVLVGGLREWFCHPKSAFLCFFDLYPLIEGYQLITTPTSPSIAMSRLNPSFMHPTVIFIESALETIPQLLLQTHLTLHNIHINTPTQLNHQFAALASNYAHVSSKLFIPDCISVAYAVFSITGASVQFLYVSLISFLLTGPPPSATALVATVIAFNTSVYTLFNGVTSCILWVVEYMTLTLNLPHWSTLISLLTSVLSISLTLTDIEITDTKNKQVLNSHELKAGLFSRRAIILFLYRALEVFVRALCIALLTSLIMNFQLTYTTLIPYSFQTLSKVCSYLFSFSHTGFLPFSMISHPSAWEVSITLPPFVMVIVAIISIILVNVQIVKISQNSASFSSPSPSPSPSPSHPSPSKDTSNVGTYSSNQDLSYLSPSSSYTHLPDSSARSIPRSPVTPSRKSLYTADDSAVNLNNFNSDGFKTPLRSRQPRTPRPAFRSTPRSYTLTCATNSSLIVPSNNSTSRNLHDSITESTASPPLQWWVYIVYTILFWEKRVILTSEEKTTTLQEAQRKHIVSSQTVAVQPLSRSSASIVTSAVNAKRYYLIRFFETICILCLCIGLTHLTYDISVDTFSLLTDEPTIDISPYTSSDTDGDSLILITTTLTNLIHQTSVTYSNSINSIWDIIVPRKFVMSLIATITHICSYIANALVAVAIRIDHCDRMNVSFSEAFYHPVLLPRYAYDAVEYYGCYVREVIHSYAQHSSLHKLCVVAICAALLSASIVFPLISIMYPSHRLRLSIKPPEVSDLPNERRTVYKATKEKEESGFLVSVLPQLKKMFTPVKSLQTNTTDDSTRMNPPDISHLNVDDDDDEEKVTKDTSFPLESPLISTRYFNDQGIYQEPVSAPSLNNPSPYIPKYKMDLKPYLSRVRSMNGQNEVVSVSMTSSTSSQPTNTSPLKPSSTVILDELQPLAPPPSRRNTRRCIEKPSYIDSVNPVSSSSIPFNPYSSSFLQPHPTLNTHGYNRTLLTTSSVSPFRSAKAGLTNRSKMDPGETDIMGVPVVKNNVIYDVIPPINPPRLTGSKQLTIPLPQSITSLEDYIIGVEKPYVLPKPPLSPSKQDIINSLAENRILSSHIDSESDYSDGESNTNSSLPPSSILSSKQVLPASDNSLVDNFVSSIKGVIRHTRNHSRQIFGQTDSSKTNGELLPEASHSDVPVWEMPVVHIISETNPFDTNDTNDLGLHLEVPGTTSDTRPSDSPFSTKKRAEAYNRYKEYN